MGDDRRSFSYYKAIPVIEKLPFKIESVDQVKHLPGIGKSLQEHVINPFCLFFSMREEVPLLNCSLPAAHAFVNIAQSAHAEDYSFQSTKNAKCKVFTFVHALWTLYTEAFYLQTFLDIC